jgi:RimJ/RimL family protein N-acetyltransferase
LSKLYVLRSARGNGIARSALSFIEAQVKALGLRKIQLTVNKFNTNSIKAYEKMGFINRKAIIQDIGNGYVMDDYVLEKAIN